MTDNKHRSEDTASSPMTTIHSATRMLRNAATLGSSQILTLASSAVLALVLPRFLGDVDLGKFSFAMAYTGFFGLVTHLGIGTFLTKEVARDPAAAGRYTVNSVLLRLPMSGITAAAGILLINVLGYDELTKRTVYVLFVNMTFMTIYDIVLASLQGLQEMRPLAISQVAVKICNSAAVTALLVTGHGPFEAAIASTCSVAAGLAVALAVSPRHFQTLRGSLDLSTWRPLILGGLPFFTWKASNVIYARIDVLMLSAFAGDAVIGWYSTAARVISIHGFLPVIVMTVAFPALAAAATEDMQAFRSITRRALQAVLLGAIPIAVGTVLLADELMEFLYPAEFSRSVPIMMILALNIPLVASDMIIGSALIALDRQRAWAFAAVAAAFLNPLMNLILIPVTHSAYDNGAIGAAAATVSTELFLMVIGLRLLPPGILDRSTLTLAARILGAAAMMVGPVWLLRDVHVLVAVAAGAITYSLACFTLRIIFVDDLQRAWGYFVARQKENVPVPTAN